MKISKYFHLLYILFLSLSCLSEDECNFESLSLVNAVIGSEEGNVNEPIIFQVFHLPNYGCTTFIGFEEQNQGINIFLIAPIVKSPCSCKKEIEPVSSNYTFTPLTPGNYTFRFRTGESLPIVKNVIVE